MGKLLSLGQILIYFMHTIYIYIWEPSMDLIYKSPWVNPYFYFIFLTQVLYLDNNVE